MRKLSILWVTLLAILFFLQPISQAFASSYDVSATIPYPAPTQPAVVDPQFIGLLTTSQAVEIFGTCQHVNPLSVVSVWRDFSAIGSVNCETNGTFRLTVSLSSGINNLIVRTSSLSSLYGPDSNAFVITYTPSQTVNTAAEPVPAAPDNATIPGELSIQTTNTFEVIDDNNLVTVQLVISGGSKPYTITINWGDGSTESKAVERTGTYAFTHTYEHQGVYKSFAAVTDVLEVSATHQFLITALSAEIGPKSIGHDNIPNKTGPAGKGSGSLGLIAVAGIVVGTLLVSTFFMFSFWLGQKFEYGKLLQTRKRPVKIRKPKKVRL